MEAGEIQRGGESELKLGTQTDRTDHLIWVTSTGCGGPCGACVIHHGDGMEEIKMSSRFGAT